MKPLAPNTLLQNRYLIIQLIGKGGMGEVYLAVDQRLGSAIALKRTFYADDEQLGNAFEREARTLARLRHPVLPKVSDHFIEKENQFLVMEHISGDDLSKRLVATQKPFPISWVLFWADQLLDALAYLHSHEPPIIHRDIKPQNLKLTDENNIILLDFGLSKNTVIQNSISGSGSTGSVVGYTPHYAPMEQIRGTGTNPRSDIYSLSATLYQLLTNTVSPDALSRADLVLGGQPDPLRPINEINGEVPKLISDIILKGMSISQEHRFPTARVMQKTLREAFAQMQSAMGAQTIAFDGVESKNSPGLELSHEKTEEYAGFSSGLQTPLQSVDVGAATLPIGFSGATIPETSVSVSANNQQSEQVPDFEATLRYDPKPQNFVEPAEVSAPVSDFTPKQADIKTEVFVATDLVADEYSQPKEPVQPSNIVTQDYGANERTSTHEERFPVQATDPLFAFENRTGEPILDKTRAVSGFGAFPNSGAGDSSVPTPFQPAEFTPPPPHIASPPVQPIAEEKKSKALLFVVVGGLFALLILVAGAVGVGLYMYGDSLGFGSSGTPTPTPVPSVSASPTPEKTPEQAGTNSSNSQIATTEPTPQETQSATPTPEKTKTGQTQTTQTPGKTNTPKQPIGTTVTPRPTATKPIGKPTSTPKRTDILQ